MTIEEQIERFKTDPGLRLTEKANMIYEILKNLDRPPLFVSREFQKQYDWVNEGKQNRGAREKR